MKIEHSAIAGTLESSDVQVMVEPSDDGIIIDLNSSVKKQYGKQIMESVHDVLDKLEVKDIKLAIQDQGALDCTLRARVQTAILRATDTKDNLPWGTKL